MNLRLIHASEESRIVPKAKRCNAGQGSRGQLLLRHNPSVAPVKNDSLCRIDINMQGKRQELSVIQGDTNPSHCLRDSWSFGLDLKLGKVARCFI